MRIWKKIGKALLFPHISVMLILLPIATVFLVCTMTLIGSETVLAYISYVLASYTLTVWCIKIPKLIKHLKTFKQENKYAIKWFSDVRLRVNVSLYGSLAWNFAYAALQMGLGIYHSSFWYYSMAIYYILLAAMRFFLVRHTHKYTQKEKIRSQLKRYQFCGWILLVMNSALSVIVFFMVYWNRSFRHHEITTIALAAYTFTTFTIAIVNVVRYRRYNSPVFSAAKAISLAAACVSMITLTSTMLTTFGGTNDLAFRRLMLGLLGGAVVAFILSMAIYMITKSTKKLKALKSEENNEQ